MTIKRAQILASMSVQLANITGSNFYTSGGVNVWTWRVTPFDPDVDMPAINVRDTRDDVVDETTAGNHMPWLHQMEVTVTAMTRSSDMAATELRQLMADIHEAIKADETFNGLALRCLYLGDEIDVFQEDERLLAATIKLRVDFRTDRYAES